MFDETTRNTVRQMAKELNVSAAALLAIAEVESGGAAFAIVDGRQEPLIRFEGHYFDQRLSAANRRRARAAGLSSPLPGGVRNPDTQARRWRLLEGAAAIDHQAAHESVSWGLGQVMGAHWRWLGFDSVDALVAEARSGASGQIRLMVRYIEKAGLADVIRKLDWEAFARAYNGPGYARNAYHTRMAAAYARHLRSEGEQVQREDDQSTPAGHTAPGRSREEVRDLQRLLSAAGYPLAIDGIAGPATEEAIRRFQADSDLKIDGIAGSKTLAALQAAIPLGDGGTGIWSAVMRLFRQFLASRLG